MTKQEPQPSFCETTSGAGTPPNDNEEANSLECKDFQTNDTFDEISVKEETLPVEDSNLQVDAQPDEDPTQDARDMLNFKESRCKYWKRKPKQCELCGKTVLDLKSHINSHYKNKPEACDFCSKRFTNRNQLLTHRNKHTRERKYPCSYCGAVYDSWMGKNYHEKAHIAEINNISYDCDKCEATFSAEKNLRNHVKFKHLNMRKLQCLDCDFSTITKVRLRNHVRSIHSKERPFRCPYCNFTSNSNTGYFIHFKRHKKSGEATEYRIKCGYCEEMFSKDAALEKHIVREHPDRAITV
uniref:Zinc finger protein 317 n=2 Tax=Culex pipiens TaxID=7175 RepID=A0A8D8IDH3_CULPI